MVDSFGEFEASSLFCPRCKQANPVRKKLLLLLPDGNKRLRLQRVRHTGRREDRLQQQRVSPRGVSLPEAVAAYSRSAAFTFGALIFYRKRRWCRIGGASFRAGRWPG
jgi:hypothetical protein